MTKDKAAELVYKRIKLQVYCLQAKIYTNKKIQIEILWGSSSTKKMLQKRLVIVVSLHNEVINKNKNPNPRVLVDRL